MSARRDYHREMTLAVLHRLDEPCTSEDLVEHIGALAQTEQHPRKFWGEISSSAVAGNLRALENQGRAVKMPQGKADGRHGRPTPLWTYAVPRDPKYPIPDPPSEEPPVPPGAPQAQVGATSAYDAYSRAELLILLEHSDEIMGHLARFITDVRESNRRHRDRLINMGGG
jgi:hypothetical protein